MRRCGLLRRPAPKLLLPSEFRRQRRPSRTAGRYNNTKQAHVRMFVYHSSSFEKQSKVSAPSSCQEVPVYSVFAVSFFFRRPRPPLRPHLSRFLSRLPLRPSRRSWSRPHLRRTSVLLLRRIRRRGSRPHLRRISVLLLRRIPWELLRSRSLLPFQPRRRHRKGHLAMQRNRRIRRISAVA